MGGVSHQGQGGDQRPSTDIEVPQVPISEVVPGGGRGGHRLAALTVLNDGKVVEGDRLGAEWSTTGVLQLAGGAQIDNGGEPQRPQPGHISGGELVQGVATEKSPPPGHTPVARRVTAQVAEVEGPIERDEPGAGFHPSIMVDRSPSAVEVGLSCGHRAEIHGAASRSTDVDQVRDSSESSPATITPVPSIVERESGLPGSTRAGPCPAVLPPFSVHVTPPTNISPQTSGPCTERQRPIRAARRSQSTSSATDV